MGAPGEELRIEYRGYYRKLPTSSGLPTRVVIDARHPASFWRAWGLSLLERNLRLVEYLGAEDIHVLVRPEDQDRAESRRFPPRTIAQIHRVEGPIGALLRSLTEEAPGPLLLLEAQVVYDRRLIFHLWQAPPPAAVDLPDSPLLIDPDDPLLEGDEWPSLPASPERERLFLLAPEAVDSRIALLRKRIEPRIVRVEGEADLKEARAFLKETAGKGVNDLLAEFVHPPIEFFFTDLLARTRITPNQVSFFNALLSAAALLLLASGHLWWGIALNLLRGVSDGVDGKLARLTLRESEGGDRIDHVVDRFYLPLFFLSLGWSLGGGETTGRPMQVAFLLVLLYGINRLLAVRFSRLVGRSSAEHRPIDRLVRRIWPKRNICVLILLVSAVLGAPVYGLYGMAALTGFMTLYRSIRLAQEWWKMRSSAGSVEGAA